MRARFKYIPAYDGGNSTSSYLHKAAYRVHGYRVQLVLFLSLSLALPPSPFILLSRSRSCSFSARVLRGFMVRVMGSWTGWIPWSMGLWLNPSSSDRTHGASGTRYHVAFLSSTRSIAFGLPSLSFFFALPSIYTWFPSPSPAIVGKYILSEWNHSEITFTNLAAIDNNPHRKLPPLATLISGDSLEL